MNVLPYPSLRSLPNLPQQSRPSAALAVLAQASHLVEITPFVGLRIPPHNRLHLIEPKSSASVHTKLVYEGWLATRTVAGHVNGTRHVGSLSGFVRRHVNSENIELSAAVGAVGAVGAVPPLKNYAPRRVIVTLLFRADAGSAAAGVFLDAMAHLQKLITEPIDSDNLPTGIGMAAFFGDDAADFRREVGLSDSLEERIVVLRFRSVEGTLVQRIGVLPHPNGLDDAFLTLQTTLLQIVETDPRLPLSTMSMDRLLGALVVPRNDLSENAWALSRQAAAADFYDRLQGSCAQIDAAVENEGVVLELLDDCWLRLIPKTRDGPPFHGFLLYDPRYKQEALEFVLRTAVEGVHNFDAPPFLRLHTCAIQLSAVFMPNVTQYTGYVDHPNAFDPLLGKSDAAIVPLQNVLINFEVWACSKMSLLPKEPSLHLAFLSHFRKCEQCYESYTRCGRGFVRGRPPETLRRDGHRAAANSPTSVMVAAEALSMVASGSLSSSLMSASVATDASETVADAAALSFGFECTNRNISVGEAYAELRARGVDVGVTDFFLQVSIVYGTRIRLVDAMGLVAKRLKTTRGGEGCGTDDTDDTDDPNAKRAARYQRIADASLRVGALERQRASTSMGSKLSPPQLKFTMDFLKLQVASSVRCNMRSKDGVLVLAQHLAEAFLSDGLSCEIVAQISSATAGLDDTLEAFRTVLGILLVERDIRSPLVVFFAWQNTSTYLHAASTHSFAISGTTLGALIDRFNTRGKGTSELLLVKEANGVLRVSSTTVVVPPPPPPQEQRRVLPLHVRGLARVKKGKKKGKNPPTTSPRTK